MFPGGPGGGVLGWGGQNVCVEKVPSPPPPPVFKTLRKQFEAITVLYVDVVLIQTDSKHLLECNCNFSHSLL